MVVFLDDDFHLFGSSKLSLEVKLAPHSIHPTLEKATLIGVSVHFKLNGFPWFRNPWPLFPHHTLPLQGNGMVPTHYGVIDWQRSCWPFIVKRHKNRLPNLIRNQQLMAIILVRSEKSQRQLRNKTNKLLFQTLGALTLLAIVRLVRTCMSNSSLKKSLLEWGYIYTGRGWSSIQRNSL